MLVAGITRFLVPQEPLDLVTCCKRRASPSMWVLWLPRGACITGCIRAEAMLVPITCKVTLSPWLLVSQEANL